MNVDALIQAAQQRSISRGLAYEIFAGICPDTGRDFAKLPYKRFCTAEEAYKTLTDRATLRGVSWRKLEVQA